MEKETLYGYTPLANCPRHEMRPGPHGGLGRGHNAQRTRRWLSRHRHRRTRCRRAVQPDHGIGDAPPDTGIGVADPPAGSPQQQRQRSSIVAVGDGVDGASVDILSAARDSNGFAAIVNGRHAPGYGWHGMKVVAGDFNGDGRMDVGAIGAGVDGHSVDLLVALANGKGGYAPIANWRHADGLGWNGMKVVAGDFNGDGRWDIGAIGDGVAGEGVDLLVASSASSACTAVACWLPAGGG